MHTDSNALQKWIIFIYGVLSYLFALGAQIWFILYLGEWEFMPHTIYDPQQVSTITALIIDVLLVGLFGLQHTGMARKWFKCYIVRLIPASAERSTYVLLSGIVMAAVVYFWQPIDGIVWRVESEPWHTLLIVGYLFGWVFSVVASFVINHFELFGLQQVWLQLKNRPEPEEGFQEKLFYRFVRHPIQLGVLIGIWLTPTMSYGHLLFTLLFTLYIFIGLYFEERDMLAYFGDVYADYRRRVGMMFPKCKR